VTAAPSKRNSRQCGIIDQDAARAQIFNSLEAERRRGTACLGLVESAFAARSLTGFRSGRAASSEFAFSCASCISARIDCSLLQLFGFPASLIRWRAACVMFRKGPIICAITARICATVTPSGGFCRALYHLVGYHLDTPDGVIGGVGINFSETDGEVAECAAHQLHRPLMTDSVSVRELH